MKVPIKRTLTQKAEAVAAGSDLVTILARALFAGVISGVSFIPNAAITGNDTETRSLSIINKGSAGIGTTEIASLDFVTGSDAVAFDEKALTLSGVAGALDVAEGDVIVVSSTSGGGTGLADPGGQYIIEVTRTNA